MGIFYRLFILCGFVLFPAIFISQENRIHLNGNKDVFGTRVFIENKGQYPDIKGEKVLYVLENGLFRAYFTSQGVLYELTKLYKLSERQRERLEEGKNVKTSEVAYVKNIWIGASGNVTVTPGERQSHYFTYGEKEFNSFGFKKLVYSGLYKDIDIEFVIPEDHETGIKYNLIVKPGADLNAFSSTYEGDVKAIDLLENGEVLVSTPVEDLIEHTPVAFAKDGSPVKCSLRLNKNVISFQADASNVDGGFVIDPWVSPTSGMSSNNYAYDVDYDFFGNTYIYGGLNAQKVSCYGPSGSLIWTFNGNVASQGWSSSGTANYASNFGVDRFNSKTYIGQGFMTNGSQVVRLNSSGNYDNFITVPASNYREIWEMGFHCVSAEVFVLGGGTNSNISAATMNTNTGVFSVSSFQPLNSSAGQDILSHAIDDAGNIFVIYASGLNLNNRLCRVNAAFNNNVWTQPSTYNTFSEIGNKSGYPGLGVMSSNGYNALAANGNYLYYYDGLNLAAYNKNTGNQVASTVVTGNVIKATGGIAVDDCDNIYIGAVGAVKIYSFNGSTFTSQSPILLGASNGTANVTDIKLDKNTKLMYVCGYGFVGVYSPLPTLACQTASSLCQFSQGGISVNSTSITCATLGSATCTAVGGTGPFTYTWIPSMQTGSVAQNLGPGTQAIVVHDIGNNVTYTAATYIAPVVPLSGFVPSIVALPCANSPSTSVSIQNLSGGSGNQYYLWTNGISTQTTAVMTNVTIGNYSVTVTDALTSCIYNTTFTVTAPPALTLNVSPSSTVACANSSIVLTPLIYGGTPPYSFNWGAGAVPGILSTTQPLGGLYVYSLTVTDSQNCPIGATTTLNFLGTPTLSVNSPSICPQQSATLTVSGANTYTWSNASNSNSIVVSPTVSTVYTVSGSGNICSSTYTTIVQLLNTPTPNIVATNPVCENAQGTLIGGGGLNYSWTGPQFFSSIASQITFTSIQLPQAGVYNLTVTAANSCTASTAITITVSPKPPLTAAGSNVCQSQTMTLNASSTSTGVTFFWFGPNSFTFATANYSLQNPAPAMSGNYSVTAIDALGCINRGIVNVAVSSLPSPVATNNSPLCQNESVQLDGSQSSGATSLLWSGPGFFNSLLTSPSLVSAQPPASGVYTLVATNGPCVVSATTQVLVRPLPVISISGQPYTCETKSLSLAMQVNPVAAQYLWQGPGAYTVSQSSFVRNGVPLSAAGIYTAAATDNYSCSSTATIAVSVYTNPVLSVSNVTVCFKDKAVLTATGAANYLWNGPGVTNLQTNTLQVQVANGSTPWIYTVTGFAPNGCSGSNTLVLNTWPLPVPSLTIYPSSEICLSQEFELAGSGGDEYVWSGPGLLKYNGRVIRVLAGSLDYSGTYTLGIKDKNRCGASKTVDIHINSLPAGSLATIKGFDCVPFCKDFVFTSSQSTSTSSYWMLDNQKYTGSKFNLCFTKSGNYILKGYLYDSKTTCSDSTTLQVEAHPKPHADFASSPDAPIENFDEVLFTSTSGGEALNRLNWFFSANAPAGSNYTTTGITTRYTFPDAGTYPVVLMVENQWHCSDTTIRNIKVAEDFEVFVPNAFTPNADGQNESFKAAGRGVQHFHFRIYDRWGALLFESDNMQAGWDGTYKGQLCKSDVYTWTIDVTSIRGTRKQMNGFVTLYR